jgi:hypothetical protein
VCTKFAVRLVAFLQPKHLPKSPVALAAIVFFLIISPLRVLSYDGCAGDSSTTSVVTEYIFFGTDIPAVNANCGYNVRLQASGSDSTRHTLETRSDDDPLTGASNSTIMASVKHESASTASNQAACIVSDISSFSLTARKEKL